METKVYLDMLCEQSVSVKTQQYITREGVRYEVGQPHRRAYVNTAGGRAELAAELAEPYLSSVMAVWGDAPTVEEQPPEIPA